MAIKKSFKKTRIILLLLGCVGIAADAAIPVTKPRIVALHPLAAEWSALILGDENLDQMVGVSEYSHSPEQLKKVPTIGAYPKVNIEAILKRDPTLILGSAHYNGLEKLNQLKALKLPLVELPEESFSDFGRWIEFLGKALGRESKAKSLSNRWNAELRQLKTKHDSKALTTFFLQVGFEPLIALGSGGFLNEAFSWLAKSNVFGAQKQTYFRASVEAVIESDPEEIYILSGMGEKSGQSFWKSKKTLRAVRKNRIRVLSAEDWARPSFRLLQRMREL